MFVDTSIDTRTRQKITELRDKARYLTETYRQVEHRLPREEVSLEEAVSWLERAIFELDGETDFFKEQSKNEL